MPLDDPPLRELADLRIAWTDDFDGVPVTAEMRNGLTELVQELSRAGVHVERKMPEGFDLNMAWETGWELFSAETGSGLPPEMEMARAEKVGIDPDSEDPFVRGFSRGVNASMRQVTAARMRRDALITVMEEFLEDWDVLLCPVTAMPAPPHLPNGSPIDVDEQPVSYRTAGLSFTVPFNLTGQPVVVIPLTQSPEGLPI